jgi:hypothetical protein
MGAGYGPKKQVLGSRTMLGPASLRVRLVVAAISLGGGACEPPPSSPLSQGSATFVAFASDFSSFRTWSSQTIRAAAPCGADHPPGPRAIFINSAPEGSSSSYPVGTIIVITSGTEGRLYAQVKRGGDFNAVGARGWEWFGLAESPRGGVILKWRGIGPPQGETTEGGTINECNGCHVVASENDFVLAPSLAGPAVGLLSSLTNLICSAAGNRPED